VNENKNTPLVASNPEQISAELTGVRLMPDEELVRVETYAHPRLRRPFSAIKAMIGLTAAMRFRDIGKHGPSNASNAMEKNPDDRESHQGKYDVFFPRDGHVVASILEDTPQLTRATIMASFEGMGVVDNYTSPAHPFDEQEVGKIAHEMRDPDDPIAVELTEKKDWGWPYYGAVDTTGKNIISIARYVERSEEGEAFLDATFTGRDGVERTVREGLDMNVAWLLGRMDLNPEGLVESLSKNPKHHANQTWADSPEAFHHADGSWAEHHPEKNLGVASLEQQGEAYSALRGAALLYELEGETQFAAELNQRADKLRAVVLEKFWVDDPAHFGGYFGRGTDRDADGNLRVLAIRTSDMGNFLDSGMLDDTDDEALNEEIRRKREAVVQNLLSEEMMSPNGVRTLSTDSYRYSDDRYHNGTTWPWVSYVTARGLRRYGYEDEATQLEDRIMDAYQDTRILGEYYSGSDDLNHRVVDQKVVVRNPTLTTETEYPVSQPAQEVQAWTTAAILAIKRNRVKRYRARQE
jgi:glycogen debranching enzyme